MPRDMVLALGHRGAPRSAPENTLDSFDAALAHGCHGFELDVRKSSDGQLVLCHDPHVRGAIVAFTTHSRLRTIFPKIVTLEQVLARYAHRAFLNIELKVVGIEQQVADLLKIYPPLKGVLVSSFLQRVVITYSQLGGATPVGFICRDPRYVERFSVLPVTHLVLNHALATPQLLAHARALGKKIVVWTVNREDQMLAFAAAGVEAIISDETELLCRVLPRE